MSLVSFELEKKCWCQIKAATIGQTTIDIDKLIVDNLTIDIYR
jgi:hypothetical protein